MILEESISKDSILCNVTSKDKLEVIDELSSMLSNSIRGVSREDILTPILEREKLGSTGIGYGVAIPHGKVEGVDRVYIAFGRSIGGVDFEAMDDKPAYLFFLIVAPLNSTVEHLKALAAISGLLKDEEFRSQLLNAKDAEAIYNTIVEGEKRI